jgi:hypothetical protein
MLSTAEASLGWSSVLNVLHDMTVKVASWPDRLIMPSAEEARLRNAVAVCEKQLEDRVATWQHLLQQQVRTQVTCSYVQCTYVQLLRVYVHIHECVSAKPNTYLCMRAAAWVV